MNKKKYFVITLHRPSNVDKETKLIEFINEIIRSSKDMPLIFPVHPRTEKILNNLGVEHPRLHLVRPMGYLEFNYLVERSFAVITDSGGITEETTVLGVPCLTLRDNTERPETVSIGTNELIGTFFFVSILSLSPIKEDNPLPSPFFDLNGFIMLLSPLVYLDLKILL